jgi:hypothetical protein
MLKGGETDGVVVTQRSEVRSEVGDQMSEVGSQRSKNSEPRNQRTEVSNQRSDSGGKTSKPLLPNSLNGANGMSDMEGKVTRVGARSEAGLAFAGSDRVSNRR